MSMMCRRTLVCVRSLLPAKNIIHRDIKLENMLLDQNGHLVLTDFGLSKVFLPHEKKHAYHSCGTLPYMAPEMIQPNWNGYTFAVDWWSVGVVAFILVTGMTPFPISCDIQDEFIRTQEIVTQILYDEPVIPDHLSPALRDLISGLLVKLWQKRLGSRVFPDIKKHPFFTNAMSFSWKALENKKLNPPVLPILTYEEDTRYFPDCIDKPVIRKSWNFYQYNRFQNAVVEET